MKSTANKTLSSDVRSTADLAKRLRLSRWTISRVLNGHHGVHAKTVARVREAMRDFGFSPDPLAQGLKTGRTRVVGICLPELEGLYLGQKLEFMRQTLAEAGYHVIVGMTNGDKSEEAETLNRFRELRAAGVILIASQLAPTSASVRRFRDSGIPLIFVDPIIRPPKGSICVDRSVGMLEAVRHLFDLGHRHIATLGLIQTSRYGNSRLNGIITAYKERGLNPSKWMRQIELPPGSFYEQGRNSAVAVWNRENHPLGHPTAVVALNDRVAIGLMDGLRRLDVRVPQDISLVGYDNMEVCGFITPQLTTIDAQPDQLVREATGRLLQKIRGEEKAEFGIAIPSRLVCRASTDRAPCNPN